MSIQTATTAQLDNAQRTIIARTLYTMEHNTPVARLLEGYELNQGESTLTVPKVGQFTGGHLTDGVDITEEQSVSMTTFDVTTVEAGMKVILTDKLARQENESVFGMVGRQIGDGMARLVETDAIALFAGLNGGTALGGDGKLLLAVNMASCINYAKAHKFGNDLVIVHHPNAVFAQTHASVVNAAAVQLPERVADKLLRNFYSFTMSTVPVFESGNIAKVSGVDSGIGGIFDRGALGMLTSKGLTTARQRDESLRATELIPVADYKAFEVDDARGAPMTYEIGDVATNA